MKILFLLDIRQEGKRIMAINIERIKVVYNGNEAYFHVLGDSVAYLDLDALIQTHKELEEYAIKHKYELNKELYHVRETHNAVSGVGS